MLVLINVIVFGALVATAAASMLLTIAFFRRLLALGTSASPRLFLDLQTRAAALAVTLAQLITGRTGVSCRLVYDVFRVLAPSVALLTAATAAGRVLMAGL